MYTNGNNSVSKSVGIYRRIYSISNSVGIYRRNMFIGIYRRNMFIGIYRRCCRRSIQFVWKYTTAWWRQAILPTDITEGFKLRQQYSDVALSPTESLTEYVRRWCRRKKPLYTLPTLSSSVSPSSSFSSHLSPPKLQPNTHPKLSTILNTSTQVSYILYVVTISVSCRFYHFFVSKSILFSFNI